MLFFNVFHEFDQPYAFQVEPHEEKIIRMSDKWFREYIPRAQRNMYDMYGQKIVAVVHHPVFHHAQANTLTEELFDQHHIDLVKVYTIETHAAFVQAFEPRSEEEDEELAITCDETRANFDERCMLNGMTNPFTVITDTARKKLLENLIDGLYRSAYGVGKNVASLYSQE